MTQSSDEATLALIHQGWDHLKLQQPLAAWAKWQQALRHEPENRAATQALKLLQESPVLPISARQAPRFHAPEGPQRRASWNEAFVGRGMADLDVAVEAFHGLAESDPDDASARYNEALCLAWLGRDDEAIAALDLFVRQSAGTEFEAAVGAWILAEVLRQGAGAEHLADELTATTSLPWPNEQADPTGLDQPGLIRMHPVSIDPETGRPVDDQTAAYEWLDRPMPDAEAVRSAHDLPQVLATIVRRPGILEISTPKPLDTYEIEQRLARAARVEDLELPWIYTPLPLRFLDAALWTFRLPAELDEDVRQRLTREAIERYYEHEWVLWSRLGLGPPPGAIEEHWSHMLASRKNHVWCLPPCLNPLDAGKQAASGDPVAHARLEAVIRMREQLASRPHMAALASGYPFDRLRRRVGIELRNPASVEPEDYSCASRAELEQLDPAALNVSVLAEAYRSASSIMLFEGVAARLGRVLVECDEHALAPGTHPELVMHLTWDAWLRGDIEEAIEWLDRAESAGHDPSSLTDDRDRLAQTIADPEGGARQYNESIGWRPDAPALLTSAAEMHRKAGRLELADRLMELARRNRGPEALP